MKKILFIAPYAAYPDVSHAGGKIFNYYFSRFYQDNDFEAAFGICNYTDSENEKMAAEYPDALNFSPAIPGGFIYKVIMFFIARIKRLMNPKYYYSKEAIRLGVKLILKNSRKNNFYPDVIEMSWTECALWSDLARKIFPKAKIVYLAHDVAYQAMSRKRKLFIENRSKLKRYDRNTMKLKREELSAMKSADLILALNEKDKCMIIEDGVLENRVHLLSPYFMRLTDSGYSESDKRGILFFGFLKRMENSSAVDWFFENVWVELKKKYPDMVFYIVGGIDDGLKKKYEDLGGFVTGFVEDPSEYFSKCFCMISPLIYGAGIKIKILEAMAMGVPVLTNEVGIEGIPAENGNDFINCVSPDDYVAAIEDLYKNIEKRNKLKINSKKMIENYFNLDRSYLNYKKLIEG